MDQSQKPSFDERRAALQTPQASGKALLRLLQCIASPGSCAEYVGYQPATLREEARRLMRQEIDGSVVDQEGRTLLHHALFDETPEMFNAVLGLKGVDVNARERASGFTVLLRAAQAHEDYTDKVLILLQRRPEADPRLAGYKGEECLWFAQQNGRPVMLAALDKRCRELAGGPDADVADLVPFRGQPRRVPGLRR